MLIVKIAIIYLIFSKTSSSGHLSDWIRFKFVIKTLGCSGKYYSSSVWWISWTSKKRTIAMSRISQKFWHFWYEFGHYWYVFRMLAQAIMMTGSDLSSSSKSWEAQYQTTAIIYEEFYEQVFLWKIVQCFKVFPF